MLLTSVELAEKWNISSRRIAYLCNEGRIDGAVKKGKTWLIPDDAKKPSDMREKQVKKENEDPVLNIQNRRYLGNKYRLLPFIEETLNEHCPGIKSMMDIFAGTGVVGYHFMDKYKIITNDSLYSNYLAHVAFMSKEKADRKKIKTVIDCLNGLNADDIPDNYMSLNFADTYFSYADCKKIGYAREYIQTLYDDGKISFREFAVLVTSVLYSMDRIANTCGHYDAYRKGITFQKHIQFYMIDISKKARYKNLFFNEDSNELVKQDGFPAVDCVYCDPPYNSRNYCDLYHVLENVAEWKKPDVSGTAKKMDRSALKSRYCSRDAAEAFEDLVMHLNCRYIVLSYNNTGSGANSRSNAKISDEEIMKILSKRGEVRVYSQKYKAFTTGKSKNNQNEERLFVCTVDRKEGIKKEDLVKSPLNYTGGKTKLLPQLLPLFPKQITTFVDLFCGGGNVGANVAAENYRYYDANNDVIGLLNMFKSMDRHDLVREIKDTIKSYGFSNVAEFGYEKYGCNSADGLSKYNKAPFTKFRKDFNNLRKDDPKYYIMLYILIIFSFNNQIRFNRNHEFNLPVGKRDFNKNIKRNLNRFAEALQKQNSIIECCDFRDVRSADLTDHDFVYADPPYLITLAGYNENSGWTEQDEKDLYAFLNRLDEKGVKFALSNVMEHKGRTNDILIEWAKKYRVHYLDYNYKNSSYHGKKTEKKTQEVLVTNY